MKCLAFAELPESCDGRRIRAAVFQERSLVPVSAACVVANAVRERLANLTGAAVPVRLFEPVVPDATGWDSIVRDAYCFTVRGALSDGAIVLRQPDALALAAWLFDEPVTAARSLSALEESVLERCVRVLTGALSPVCGHIASPPERVQAIGSMSTFFELKIDGKCLRIGVALAREPGPTGGPGFSAAGLMSVELELAARVECLQMPAMALAEMVPGAIVPLGSSGQIRASMLLDGAPIAGGELGVRGQRYAVAVDMPMIIERE